MYWKIKLSVPKGIRFLSQWNDFSLTDKFQGKNILHKQLPGCGFTEFALICPESVVLCSPRKMLMENKKEQHGEDVYLVVSKFDRTLDIDADMSKPKSESEINKEVEIENRLLAEKLKEEDNYYNILFQEIGDYITRMGLERKPIKIIVTYDSAYLVKKILKSMGIINSFWFVVDEFQSILEDARFKADTESNFITTTLPDIKNVLFVSATPMLDKYIQRIPELNLPYYELDWAAEDSTRIKKPSLKIRTMKSVSSKMGEIIQSYLEGNFEKAVVERDGKFQEIYSTEAVLFVNSVNHIINIIKKMGLTPDQVNILCSDTLENQDRINKKLGKRNKYLIGKIPTKGEPHKMFTFCTRTVYLGADFYSLCARSFIFSDSNSDCLAVDISMDLNQILGRQRLDENPWKNSAEFYYRATCDYKKMTWEDFRRIVEKKEKDTKALINVWTKGDDSEKDVLSTNYLYIVKSLRYRYNYMAVNKKEDGSQYPVVNNLVSINDERTFDIQQVDYADRFSVFCKVNDELKIEDNNTLELFSFYSEYDSLTTYVEKIHYIVDYILGHPDEEEIIVSNLSDSDKIKQQLITVGAKRIKGLGYNITKIKQAMGVTIFNRDSLDKEIYSLFVEGKRYTKKFIKEELKTIYKSAGFEGTAKAVDLENWFEIRETRITIDGKREIGFEIIKKKQILL